MRAAAGAGARIPKLETRRQHRLELLLTLRKAREEPGRWPTAGEWEAAADAARHAECPDAIDKRWQREHS